ncbi:P-loop containing nucleoside triphosphate hydrolase protein [Phlebopus sp. FC_14]|nr:P-loop containing nucleoside triphosphate hydrolase protein [Phlebopus sp. FC_14]
MPNTINIILFGETGVGKSSVINLIAGAPVADVSPDVEGCTMASKEYKFTVDSKKYCIWDTVGLEEPEMGINGYLDAIVKALVLINRLTDAGGVNLLLFCMRGNRVTATTQSNYRLFYEVLCGKQVPIALVITHLERETHMEDWWSRNEKSIEKYGIKSAGHACVTGVDDRRENGKYAQSRVAIHELLKNCDGYGTYTMPPEAWFVRVLQGLGLFAGAKGPPKGKKLMETLTKRCRLEPAAASRIISQIEQSLPHIGS